MTYIRVYLERRKVNSKESPRAEGEYEGRDMLRKGTPSPSWDSDCVEEGVAAVHSEGAFPLWLWGRAGVWLLGKREGTGGEAETS